MLDVVAHCQLLIRSAVHWKSGRDCLIAKITNGFHYSTIGTQLHGRSARTLRGVNVTSQSAKPDNATVILRGVRPQRFELNQQGGYQNHHRVYNRDGQPCGARGKSSIRRIVQVPRSTYFCAKCQRKGKGKGKGQALFIDT